MNGRQATCIMCRFPGAIITDGTRYSSGELICPLQHLPLHKEAENRLALFNRFENFLFGKRRLANDLRQPQSYRDALDNEIIELEKEVAARLKAFHEAKDQIRSFVTENIMAGREEAENQAQQIDQDMENLRLFRRFLELNLDLTVKSETSEIIKRLFQESLGRVPDGGDVHRLMTSLQTKKTELKEKYFF